MSIVLVLSRQIKYIHNMLSHKASGQTQALLNLLTIDDETELHRYRQTNLTEPNIQYLDTTFLKDRARKSGKENQIVRKQVLPKLNSSKQELKLLLRRLECNEVNRKSEILQERALQPFRLYQNQTGTKVAGLKSYREAKQSLPNKQNRKIMRTNQPRSQLSFIDGRAQQIQQLIRRNNYSANALNMKTLNILHEINTKNSRCTSGIKKKRGKIPQCVKPVKKNLVTFLRKVA